MQRAEAQVYTMLLKFYEDKRCVSAIDLLLVRNLYELGYPEPDPNVSVSFTPQQREAASSLFFSGSIGSTKLAPSGRASSTQC